MPLLQNIFFTISCRNVIDEHKKINNFVIVIYIDFAYNKSVIIKHKTPIKM